eukprot:scaffold548038_cov19-Prasinocladus_malaysianus.AAC.1
MNDDLASPAGSHLFNQTILDTRPSRCALGPAMCTEPIDNLQYILSHSCPSCKPSKQSQANRLESHAYTTRLLITRKRIKVILVLPSSKRPNICLKQRRSPHTNT